ncbi:MAG TPA: hypothetical protein VMG36_00860 [Thermoplasmata archaeon]|nr:hypothetical protein [Thermoplasmata archaeon]
MAVERTPVLVAFLLILIGFLMAVIVVSFLPIPEPPACYTFLCNAADVIDLVGLFLLVIGMGFLGRALLRASKDEPGPVSTNPQYSFTGTPLPPAAPPATVVPPPATPPSPATATGPRRCPACGASVTTEYGFCPRCGQSLSR